MTNTAQKDVDAPLVVQTAFSNLGFKFSSPIFDRINLGLRRVLAKHVPILFKYFSAPAQLGADLCDPRQFVARRYLASRYIRGVGVEIGALHAPLEVSSQAKVKYVDRMSAEMLRHHYPELEKVPLIDPDIIDDGEKLDSIGSESLDFIIANHFIEHCEDPIGTLKNHLSKLKVGGVLYLAIPQRSHTFDRSREVTSIEHLVADYHHGPGFERRVHYEDWVRNVLKLEGKAFENEVERLLAQNYSIHFHVWDDSGFDELLLFMRDKLNFSMNIIARVSWEFNPFEVVYLIRKEGVELARAA